MDDSLVFGDLFDLYLKNLKSVFIHYEGTNLVQNQEKCHFIIQEGILLGHKISHKGIEVDKAKVETIEKLTLPTLVNAIRSFLGHAGFYTRFINDFSKIARPLTQLLEKDASFNFSVECMDLFNILNDKLIPAPIMISPDWNILFELMCNASDYVVRGILGVKEE